MIGIPDFWIRLRKASHRILVLDYDGTLAPFQVERMKAVPLPGMLQTLQSLRRTGIEIAICSGRPIRELRELMPSVHGLTMYGSHGYERLDPDGSMIEFDVPARQRDGLCCCYEAAERAIPLAWLEKKIASVALHVRGIEDGLSVVAELRRIWTGMAVNYDLSLLDFDGGIEVRATNRDKGTALTELIEARAPGAFCVYIGDDATDEDAFVRVKGHGVGIRIGNPQDKTSAEGHLRDCAALLEHLRCWSRVLGYDRGEEYAN